MSLSFWQNLREPPLAWMTVLLLALAATFVLRLALKHAAKRIQIFTDRTSSHWDNAIPDLLLRTKPWVLFVWSFGLLAQSLYQPEFLAQVLHIALVAASTVQLTIWGLRILYYWHQSRLIPRIQNDRSSAAALSMFYTAMKAALVLAFVLVGLSHIGVNISAFLTGLGIGGIAVALAAQNILGDLLASLSIILDKPFVVGDFIVSGNELGTVEYIGIKTTRIRSLSGEQIVLSNKDLLESRVRNFQRLERRRSAQKFSVPLSTPPETLEQIPRWVEDIVKSHDLLQFDTCALIGITTASFDFEMVFFVSGSDWARFLALQQKVLVETVTRLQREGVSLAVPVQEMRLQQPLTNQNRERSAFSN